MNIAIWTDNDLDGAGSALLMKLLFNGSNVFIKEVNDYSFIGEYKGWIVNEGKNFDKIFITDLFVHDDLVEYVDKPNVCIIDHHKSHVDVKDRFKAAKALIEVDTSCVNLIRKIFKSKLDNILNEDLNKLFDIIDDYDNYTLRLPEALKLNAVYHNYNKPKVDKFIERFETGFTSFNVQEQNAIKLYFNRLKELIDKTQFFSGEIQGKKVVSCFADHSINEIAHYGIKKHSADISIVVNLNTKAVSFRKNRECDVKLDKLANILCNGGGHEYAAGGRITDKFLAFTKTLQSI